MTRYRFVFVALLVLAAVLMAFAPESAEAGVQWCRHCGV